MRTRWLTGWAGVLAVAFVASLGCLGGSDKETAHLQGTVTIGGQPIPADASAMINFRPTEVTQANGISSQIQNGRYDASAAPRGKVLVTFDILQPTGEIRSFDGFSRPEPVMRSLVPSGKESGIEVQVDGDESDLDFDL